MKSSLLPDFLLITATFVTSASLSCLLNTFPEPDPTRGQSVGPAFRIMDHEPIKPKASHHDD